MKIFIILSFYFFSVFAKSDTLLIPGSGSPEAILKKLAAAYNSTHPGDIITIPPSTRSAGGFKTIQAGEEILARVSHKPELETEKDILYIALMP